MAGSGHSPTTVDPSSVGAEVCDVGSSVIAGRGPAATISTAGKLSVFTTAEAMTCRAALDTILAAAGAGDGGQEGIPGLPSCGELAFAKHSGPSKSSRPISVFYAD